MLDRNFLSRLFKGPEPNRPNLKHDLCRKLGELAVISTLWAKLLEKAEGSPEYERLRVFAARQNIPFQSFSKTEEFTAVSSRLRQISELPPMPFEQRLESREWWRLHDSLITDLSNLLGVLKDEGCWLEHEEPFMEAHLAGVPYQASNTWPIIFAVFDKYQEIASMVNGPGNASPPIRWRGNRPSSPVRRHG